jgi:hypothetical protein
MFWIFWFERFCCCCSIISASLKENEIMKWDDFLWFVKISELRFLSFSNIISKILFRVLSNSEIFSDDSAKFSKDSSRFWEDFEKFWEDSTDDFDESLKLSANDASMLLNWAIDYFSLFFRKKIWVDCTFDEKFFDNLNDTLINSLNDLLFLKNVFEMIDLMSWDVLEIFASSSIDDDLDCSKIFLRFFNHFAKSMISRVTIRIAMLKNFWFNAQSVRTKSFSLICSKNRIISRKSWWLAEDNLTITEKFRLLFTNSRRRCACRMMWSLRDECFEVKLINREMFTRKEQIKQNRRWMTR